MVLNTSPEVRQKFDSYPAGYKEKLLALRQLVLDTAAETEGVDELEETLKWREPSYLTKHGSTIRMDYKDKGDPYYAIYFKCTSKLVASFQQVYGDTFTYEKTRGMHFSLEDNVPVAELKQCVRAALTYHKVKNIPLLGLQL